LTRNEFNRSDMDFSMAYEASVGVYESVWKVQDQELLAQKHVQ